MDQQPDRRRKLPPDRANHVGVNREGMEICRGSKMRRGSGQTPTLSGMIKGPGILPE